jgi:hypothetical protein
MERTDAGRIRSRIVTVVRRETPLAGAAQRRGKLGLLHQGSVATAGDSRLRGELFAERLADSWWQAETHPDDERIAEIVALKYGRKEWLERR